MVLSSTQRERPHTEMHKRLISRHGSRRTFPSHIGQSTASNNWKNRSNLKLKLENLPTGVTTLDISQNFEHYGTLVYIKIFETGSGGRSSNAEIVFEPVPARCFWEGGLDFRIGGQIHRIRAHVKEQPLHKARIQSPVDERVNYPEKIEVLGHALDFGFLVNPTSMQIAATCTPASIILNLKKKEFEMHFTFIQQSKTVKARKFRFLVALDDHFKIWQVNNSLVLHLRRPPLYSKMLSENKASSHAKDGRMWTVDDMWARQSDLCAAISTYARLQGLPIGLPKTHNTINIARWTTFRFTVRDDPYNQTSLEEFLAAMRDWNTRISDGCNFTFDNARATLDHDAWCKIDGFYQDSVIVPSLIEDFPRVHLPFAVRYQLEVCLSNNRISEYSITPQFLQRLVQFGEDRATQVLVHVATNADRIYDPLVIFDKVEYSKPQRPRKLPDNCTEVRSATVTATSIIFHTPTVELANRILRKHRAQGDRFLRVRFADDEYRGQTKLWPSLNAKMVSVFKRVHRTLTNGIELGERHYHFLAWGSSQLRQHGVYFVAPTESMTPDSIRKEMGTFKEKIVAKKAARMGQCFSTTKAMSLKLHSIDEHTLIPDIIRGKYNFTDGVGKISQMAADLVRHELQIKGQTPSLFQFRLGGCKGVLAVSKDLKGISLEMRESQFKFNSLAGELEIIRCSEYWQPYLNRQIIICLSYLGVPTRVFLRMQFEYIRALNQALLDDGAAIRLLRSNIDPNMMTLSICDLVEAGFRAIKEPFTSALLHLWRTWSLKFLKEKGRIPVEKGAFVLGSVDETASLRGHTSACPRGMKDEIFKDPQYLDKLPEIFLQITNATTGKPKIIEGICFLARNPSLHPGDIRVVRACNVPILHHMRDVVVMPQLGERDLPSMCSGGDLDGDDYIVIWDPDLIPDMWNVEPFHYEPPVPREADAEITTTHLIDFFCNYIRFDHLGKIAHAHLGAADALDDGIASDVCLELLELHSQAVDYPKTGVPADMPRRLQRDRWPHFMEKRGEPRHSKKVLGQLYDAVQTVSFNPDYAIPFDARIINAFEPSAELYESVQDIKREYDSSVQRTLTQHCIKTEFELWSTFVLDHSKASNDYKFHEEVGNLSRTIKSEYFGALCALAGGKDYDHLAPIAVTAYRVTQDELESAKKEALEDSDQDPSKSYSMPFISFPWVLQETLITIATRLAEPKRTSSVATVKNGGLIERESDLLVGDSGKGFVEVSGIKSSNLTANKMSHYMSDPAELYIDTADASEFLDEGSTSNHDEDEPTVNSPLIAPPMQADSPAKVNADAVLNALELVKPTNSVLAGSNREATLTIHDHLPVLAMDDQVPIESPAQNATVTQNTGNQMHFKKMTCFYWKTYGHCKFTEGECKHAHFDTGRTAPPPPNHAQIQGCQSTPRGRKTKQLRTRTAVDDSDSEDEIMLQPPANKEKLFSSAELYDIDDEDGALDKVTSPKLFEEFPASGVLNSPARSGSLSAGAPPFVPTTVAALTEPEGTSDIRSTSSRKTGSRLSPCPPQPAAKKADEVNLVTVDDESGETQPNTPKYMADPADISGDEIGSEELSD